MQYKSRLCFVVHIIQQSILIPPTSSMINIAGLILSSALAVQALPFNISMSQLACLHWLGNFKHTFTGSYWRLLTEANSRGFYYKELDS